MSFILKSSFMSASLLVWNVHNMMDLFLPVLTRPTGKQGETLLRHFSFDYPPIMKELSYFFLQF